MVVSAYGLSRRSHIVDEEPGEYERVLSDLVSEVKEATKLAWVRH